MFITFKVKPVERWGKVSWMSWLVTSCQPGGIDTEHSPPLRWADRGNERVAKITSEWLEVFLTATFRLYSPPAPMLFGRQAFEGFALSNLSLIQGSCEYTPSSTASHIAIDVIIRTGLPPMAPSNIPCTPLPDSGACRESASTWCCNFCPKTTYHIFQPLARG